MNLRTLTAAACLSVCTATAGLAATISVEGTDYDLGFVSGTFNDNQAQIEAQPFFLDNPLAQSFAQAAHDVGALADLGISQLNFNITEAGCCSFSWLITDTSTGPSGVSDPKTEVTFYATVTPVAVSAVPLPAGGLLLLSAFGGVAALKRKKKHAA